MFNQRIQRFGRQRWAVAGLVAVSALCICSYASAQYDRDSNRPESYDRVTTLVPGTVIPVRTTEEIDVTKGDYRVYNGIVDQDVRGNDGRLAIRRGSNVELIVRFAQDNDMILDLDSVTSGGQRYAVRTDRKRVPAQYDNSLVGNIIGAISGGQARGQAVRIPRDTVVTFRLQRSLDVGVPDQGIMRDGRHYHDYERDWYGNPTRRDPNQYPNRDQYPSRDQYPNR